MIRNVVIRDNTRLPYQYAKDLPSFANGREYIFKDGVNVIVGKNGCGKSTLFKTLKAYLMVAHDECGAKDGEFSRTVDRLRSKWQTLDTEDIFLDGVDVYADYRRNVFAFTPRFERTDEYTLSSFRRFGDTINLMHASSGEQTASALSSLFNLMFSKDAKLKFDYENEIRNEDYQKYVAEHRVECEPSWTVLMDEPDSSMDIGNAEQVYGILSQRKKNTQIIAVVHNPLLIYKLSTLKGVNIIEMSEGYVDEVRSMVDKFLSR